MSRADVTDGLRAPTRKFRPNYLQEWKLSNERVINLLLVKTPKRKKCDGECSERKEVRIRGAEKMKYINVLILIAWELSDVMKS